MPPLLSWAPIDTARWEALAWVIANIDEPTANDLTASVAKLRTAWNRLRDDLNALFIPAGPPGTHAHHHYHAPTEPAERRRVVDACVTDYESALIFLTTALDATACALGRLKGGGTINWGTLATEAASSATGLTPRANDAIAYLNTTVRSVRNTAIVHPRGEIVELTYDNVGNVTFWRIPDAPAWNRLAELNDLLHRVRPDIRDDALVGRQIAPWMALTWVGALAAAMSETDRQLFVGLRSAIGYALPGPYELAPEVDALIDAVADEARALNRGRLALLKVPGPVVQTEEVAEPEPPTDEAVIAAVRAAIDQGEAGHLREAEQELDVLLQERPVDPLVLIAMAETKQKQGEYEAAVSIYRRASAVGIPYEEVKAGLACCHFNLGAAAYSAGDMDTAAKHYEEALHYDPTDAEAHGHLAIALGRAGNTQRALLAADRAVTAHPDVFSVRLDVGTLLLMLNQPALALEQLEAAVGLGAASPDAHAQLGVALLKLGRVTDGRKALEEALCLNPELAAARANLDRLDRATREG